MWRHHLTAITAYSRNSTRPRVGDLVQQLRAGLNERSYSTPGLVNTWMGDCRWL